MKSARVRPDVREAALERGQRDLAHVPLGGERVQDHAVGDLARDLGHEVADRGEHHLRRAVRVRAGVEERRHERVRVELAREVELLPPFHAAQIARSARMNSRMRAAGCDHGIEKRCSMCGLIWLPRPRVKRPFDASCRSLAIDAIVIGVRANAMATPVDSSSRSVRSRREQQREERVVARLGGGAAVVAVGLERHAPGPRSRRTTRPASRRSSRPKPTVLRHPLSCHTPAVPSLS